MERFERGKKRVTRERHRHTVFRHGNGVALVGPHTTNNRVIGNIIGVDPAGALTRGNAGDGVFLAAGAVGNFIGGHADGEGNMIAGNGGSGVHLLGDHTTDNVVEGNLIGSSGNAAGNRQNGVFLDGAGANTIGGFAPGSENVISGNNVSGILIEGSGATGNRILANIIGLDFDGSTLRPNQEDGVTIADAPNNLIGDVTASARNLSRAASAGASTSPAGTGNVIAESSAPTPPARSPWAAAHGACASASEQQRRRRNTPAQQTHLRQWPTGRVQPVLCSPTAPTATAFRT